ncbi:MAG: DUF3108 domain-containing protein [Deltaproteobacteria bacterium]|nr:DUF3108 domain-containing protein [Deltaproteobacteria bacterium]
MKISHIKIKHTLAIIAYLLIILINPAPVKSEEVIFYPGEKMTFEVRWSFVVAAETTLEVMPNEDMDGTPSLHFVYTAKTSPFVDNFYKVRDRIESWTDTGLKKSLLYKKRHEKKTVKGVIVQFDWNKLEARQIKNGNITDTVIIEENTFDPLSVFYAFRVGRPDEHNCIKINLTDGKKVIRANAKLLKKQKITIAEKSYDTILVEPEIEGISGVFQKTKDSRMQIWITDDNKRIPVRIKSRVTVGSFIADLISYSPGENTPGLNTQAH